VAQNIIKQDGFGGLYKGLSAGLLRQATYTTARLGIFQELSTYLKKVNEGRVRPRTRFRMLHAARRHSYIYEPHNALSSLLPF
jgi:hypothetical protein